MSDVHTQPGNGVSLEKVAARIQGMSEWAQTVERRLNGVPDAKVLWAEADALAAQYSDVPGQIRELEQGRATLAASIVSLREQLEIIEANLSLVCDGGNKETRAAQLRIAMAEHEDAAQIAKELADKELDIKLLDVEIEEKERIWSDYHRKVVILASKAGVSYR